MTILQHLIVGIIQGITEWLPLSSSGMNVLIMSNFFGITEVSVLLKSVLFLHLGTFFAALIYFRKEVVDLFKAAFNYREAPIATKKTLKFLLSSTIVTGIVGILLIKILVGIDLQLTGKVIALSIGALLLLTGVLQLVAKKKGHKDEKKLTAHDGSVLGLTQGLAVIPGLSRSGITISTFLLKDFDDTAALRLSFLMSLPVVLLGNILINLPDIATTFTSAALVGLLGAFVFGLLTIHAMMKISKKINFAWFIIIFALLMMFSYLF